MASASKRLNERLAKYNHLYDDEDQQVSSESSTDMADTAVLTNGTSDASVDSVNENSNENNNIIVPDTIPVKKITDSVSLHENVSDLKKCDGSNETSMSSNNGVVSHAATASENGGVPITSSSSSNADISNQDINKREAFLKGDTPGGKYEAPSTKFDPSLRERDGKAEKIEKSAPPPKAEKPDIKLENHRPAAVNRSESSKSLEGYVGFANLPNQVYRKSVKRGFEFTMMVVGEAGLGKSTMINSLFLSELYNANYPGPSLRTQKTVQIDSTQVLLKESGVQLKLTVVDTPGFGDEVDNTDCWKPITAYVDNKYEEYLNAESKVNRKTMPDDNRVHCCLYFISPTGHSLKPLDIEVMKRLHEKVNIIPLIAKADSMTPEECRDFKKNILNEIQRNKIRIYEFPEVDDEEENKELKKLKDRVPYAVVGSNKVMEVNGKKVRGRQYPWGLVEVDNLVHNDFLALRDMLIRTHMQDLKDVTNNVHYENFRYKKLADVSSTGDKVDGGNEGGDSDPLTQMENQKNDHKLKMKKMEAEMEHVFEMKVKEKMQKLKDSEVDLAKRADLMKKSLEQQEAELNQKREAFLQEKSQWESIHKYQDDIVSMKGKKKGIFN